MTAVWSTWINPLRKVLPEDVAISTTPEVGAKITLRQPLHTRQAFPEVFPVACNRSKAGTTWNRHNVSTSSGHQSNWSRIPAGRTLFQSRLRAAGTRTERAADKPFDQLLKETICEPFQLERTAIPTDDTLRTGDRLRREFMAIGKNSFPA